MNYTIYDSVSGEILYTISGTGNDIILNLVDKTYIEGSYNQDQYYVDINTQTICNKPASPSTCHVWNAETKTWDLDTAQATVSARQQRDRLLSEIDRVNPVWYASLTAEQQEQLIAYRQQLLDVPQQEGFPITIDWPIRPGWL